jgi:hypothetical protein
MPNNWLRLQEITDLTGWHPQYVRRLAREGRLEHRPSKGAQRDGRPEREYALSSLPAQAQLKFHSERLLGVPAGTGLTLASHSNQGTLFSALPEVSEPERISFSSEQNAQAMKRLEASHHCWNSRGVEDGLDQPFAQMVGLLSEA